MPPVGHHVKRHSKRALILEIFSDPAQFISFVTKYTLLNVVSRHFKISEQGECTLAFQLSVFDDTISAKLCIAPATKRAPK